MGIIC